MIKEMIKGENVERNLYIHNSWWISEVISGLNMKPSAVPLPLTTVAEPRMVLAGEFLLREEGLVVMR